MAVRRVGHGMTIAYLGVGRQRQTPSGVVYGPVLPRGGAGSRDPLRRSDRRLMAGICATPIPQDKAYYPPCSIPIFIPKRAAGGSEFVVVSYCHVGVRGQLQLALSSSSQTLFIPPPEEKENAYSFTEGNRRDTYSKGWVEERISKGVGYSMAPALWLARIASEALQRNIGA